MKHKIAVILCMALCATTLFGCSSSELGYLQMSKDLSKIRTCEMSGNAEVYYDAEAIKDYIFKNLGNMEYTREAFETQYAGFEGQKKLGLSYEGSMSLEKDNFELYLDMTASVDGKQQPLGDVYVSLADGVYVERDIIINLYKLSKDIVTGYQDSYFYSESYEKDLRAALGTSEYIEVINGEVLRDQLDVTGLEAEIFAFDEDVSKTIMDAAFTFITDLFKGYSTNAVSAVNGGYSISVTGSQVTDLISGLLDYLAKNVDTVVSSVKTYMTAIYGTMEKVHPEMIPDKGDVEAFDIDDTDKLVITGVLSGLKGQFDYLVKSGKLELLKAFTYKETVKKSGDAYIGEGLFSLDEGNKNLGYLKTSSKLVPVKKERVFPSSGTDVNIVMDNIDKVERKYNPVNSAEITWEKTTNADARWYSCDITYYKLYKPPFESDSKYQYSKYKNVNKSMYLPLRQLCDAFGEEVGWDNKTKQAYITKNGEKISIQGMLDTKTTYIKVTEFEKLGYTVIYDGKDADYHKVTITRE